MKLLDSAVWQYLKENVELIEQEQIRSLNDESIQRLQEEIESIEAKIADKEKSKAKEANLYRAEIITLSELESKVAPIKRDIDSFRSAIKNKQAEIETIKDFISNHIAESATELVLSAEGNKAEMKKYVNRFISKIVVHLSNHSYTILEVKPKKFMGATKAKTIFVPVVDEDADGNIVDGGYKEMQIQDMSFEVNDSDYIIIDKKRKIAFVIDNTILAHSVSYDRDYMEFIYTNNYDGGVRLSIDTIVGFYLMSQSSNKETIKTLKDNFDITFKPLTY